MKKVIALVLVVAMTFSLAISASAFSHGHNDFEGPAEGTRPADAGISLNTNSGDGALYGGVEYGLDYVTTRYDFTPSRAMDPDRENALFVDGIEGNDGTCILVNNPWAIFPDSSFGGNYSLSADMKATKVVGFAGILVDPTGGSTSSGEVPHPNTVAAERDKAHDYEYPLYTGYGFTFLAGKTDKIRLFVNASKTGEVDYVDIDAADTSKWHNYAMYEDVSAKKNYFYIDGALVAVFDFNEDNGKILDRTGKAILENTNNFFGTAYATLAFTGENIEFYFDNLNLDNWTELPAVGGERSFDKAKDSMAYDAIYVNGEVKANGNDPVIALKKNVDGSNGDISSVGMYGWFGSDEAKVDTFGYRIDGGVPVYDKEFFKPETEQAVKDAKANGERYTITVDVSAFKDGKVHEIEALALLEDGTIVMLDRFEEGKDRDAYILYKAPASKDVHGASFDTIYVDGVMNFGEADGSASDKLDAVNRTVDGSENPVTTIKVRGWIGFEQEIDAFGYKINDNEPVFGEFKQNTEGAVKLDGNGGALASRFQVEIPVAELKGTNTIVAVVKLADGTVIEIDENCKANGAGTAPNTKITFVGPSAPEAELHGASFDTLYINDEMNFGDGDGSASDKLDGHDRTVDGSNGSVQTLRVRGWIGFESAIAQFGYKINDNAPVFGDFAIAPEAAVVDPANGGEFASRFDITIPVEDLKGTNTIVAVVKLADGTIVEIDENVTANGAGTAPNTQLTYVGPAAAPETQPETEAPVTEAPQTGDASIMAIAMIAVIALAAVLVIRKKVTE